MNSARWLFCVVSCLLVLGAYAGSDALGDEAIGHKKTVWQAPGFKGHRKAAMKFGAAYKKFLGANKTEREVVAAARKMALSRGYRDLLASDKRRAPTLAPGAKLYAVSHGKMAAFVRVGTLPLSKGMHIVAAHIDAVRIDLKQNPLYADGNVAMLQTHYYGGIKRYQWLSQPLELRGVVVTRSGKVVPVSIGGNPRDPVLVIPDIAVHVARYVDKKEGEQVPGEALDPILSSTPTTVSVPGKDPFAAEAARLLKTLYRIDVADLASAELELVPAGAPRDVGIDRAMVGGYGQDDRACSYAALRALFAAGVPKHTAVVMLVDKEEIGSTGNTGARSNFVRRVAAELLERSGVRSTTVRVDAVLSSSLVFSADVTGAVNPHYKKLYERKNAAFIGGGVVWNQTGVHAKVMAYVRRLLHGAGVTHQAANWGKSRGSKGEGGTVLPYFTKHGMNGIEVSIPLLSMHAPFEVISKADLYEGYRAYRAFLRD